VQKGHVYLVCVQCWFISSNPKVRDLKLGWVFFSHSVKCCRQCRTIVATSTLFFSKAGDHREDSPLVGGRQLLPSSWELMELVLSPAVRSKDSGIAMQLVRLGGSMSG